MVLGSFVADALALGVHWIYDPGLIARRHGRVETLLAPADDSWHAGKARGDLTHYGDQALVLLESAAGRGCFDAEDFFRRWLELLEDYDGYRDQAMRRTLENYRKTGSLRHSGSDSDELGGAARIAPLVYFCRRELTGLVDAAREQTELTHADPQPMAAAEFFARVTRQVLEGVRPVAAITEVTMHRFRGTALEQWVEAGMSSRNSDTVEAIGRLGPACATPGAFAGVVHLVTRYENDLREALVQNVMAGGDSAARGLVAGMVLGAHLGMEAVPGEWLSGLHCADYLREMLSGSGTA